MICNSCKHDSDKILFIEMTGTFGFGEFKYSRGPKGEERRSRDQIPITIYACPICKSLRLLQENGMSHEKENTDPMPFGCFIWIGILVVELVILFFMFKEGVISNDVPKVLQM